MEGYYYDDPIEAYESDENARYSTEEGYFGGQTGPMNNSIGDFYSDDLDLEYGEYMRTLSSILTTFLYQGCLRQHR
jgi:hypothetical protein